MIIGNMKQQIYTEKQVYDFYQNMIVEVENGVQLAQDAGYRVDLCTTQEYINYLILQKNTAWYNFF